MGDQTQAGAKLWGFQPRPSYNSYFSPDINENIVVSSGHSYNQTYAMENFYFDQNSALKVSNDLANLALHQDDYSKQKLFQQYFLSVENQVQQPEMLAHIRQQQVQI